MYNIVIKTAQENDFSTCRLFDHYNADHVLKEKITKSFVYLAYNGEECIGYLCWGHFWSRFPNLCWIEVKENARSQGIGKKLLEHFFNEIQKLGHKFCLSSSQENEEYAISWQKSQGFTEIGKVDTLNDDGSSEIFLRKDL